MFKVTKFGTKKPIITKGYQMLSKVGKSYQTYPKVTRIYQNYPKNQRNHKLPKDG